LRNRRAFRIVADAALADLEGVGNWIARNDPRAAFGGSP